MDYVTAIAWHLFTLLGPFLAVDLLTGFGHWLEDTYGSPDTPFFGKWVIRDNVEHHRHPMAFTRTSFWSRNWMLIVFAALLLPVWWFLGWITPAWALALALGGVTNEIHAFTHISPANVPLLIRWLQRLRILQTRLHHVVGHHRSPFDGHYCILLNVLNPILDGLGFWRGLEAVVEFVTGIPPRARETAGAATEANQCPS